MNPNDTGGWSAVAGDVNRSVMREVRLVLAKVAVDSDGALDVTWQVLQQKRGCRR